MISMCGRHRLIVCVTVCLFIHAIPSLVPEFTVKHSQQHSDNSTVSQLTPHLFFTVSEHPVSDLEVRSHNVFSSDGDRRYTGSMICQVDGRVADCSKRSLQQIPDDLPAEITILDLSYNIISNLPDNSFANYSLLQQLNISSNKLHSLGNASFENLSHLITLDLYNNCLAMRAGVYPDDVFMSLTSLQHLNISSNNRHTAQKGLEYPHVALSRLTGLQELHMDGLNVTVSGPLGPGFQNMTRLTNLSLAGYTAGYCNMYGLRNDTFQNVKFLEYLNIASCWIQADEIHSGTFFSLASLRHLDLSYNEDINVNNLDRIFYSLKNAINLTHLHMNLINNRYSMGVCLESKYLENFPTSVVYLDARENSFEAIDRHAIAKLASLQKLDLSGNRFVFGLYLSELPKLKNLIFLKINGGQSLYTLPKIYPFILKTETLEYHEISNCTIYSKGEVSFVLELPPRLEYLEMNNASLKYTLSELNVSTDNSLTHLSLSGNHFPSLEGPIYGLHSLKHLDISLSFVTDISEKFFQNLTTLEVLILHSNILGPIFAKDQRTRIFSCLTSLQILDLTFNAIESIRPETFLELRNLSTLLLARNPLIDFDMQISHMNKLMLLNLSSSHIPSLPIETQQHITGLIHKGLNVTVDLSYVQINCDCINRGFLIWMTSCGAFHIEPQKYLCSFGLSEKIITDGYASTISALNRKCMPETLLVLISGCCSVLMIVFVIAGLIFRFRWNIRYMYYAAYLRYKNISIPPTNYFEFDAFVCYAEEDMNFAEKTMEKELTERGVKTLLHRRDFMAGQLISSNIVEAVSRSRRTVVVLTRSLMESHWCKYEIEMAKMEGVYSGRQVLVFLIVENIPRQMLGRDLLYNIKNNTYLEYPSPPHDTDQMKLWWDKLVNDIKE